MLVADALSALHQDGLEVLQLGIEGTSMLALPASDKALLVTALNGPGTPGLLATAINVLASHYTETGETVEVREGGVFLVDRTPPGAMSLEMGMFVAAPLASGTYGVSIVERRASDHGLIRIVRFARH